MSNVSVEMVHIDCCTCGIVFSVPKEWHDHRHKWGYRIVCPNGHKFHYTGKDEPDPDEFKAVKDKAITLEGQLDQAKAEIESLKTKLEPAQTLTPDIPTSLRHVCPQCGKRYRSANWVSRHVAKEHETTASA